MKYSCILLVLLVMEDCPPVLWAIPMTMTQLF